MKRKIANIFIIILVLGGVVVLSYPYISFWLSERNQSYVMQDYDDSLANMTSEQIQFEWERARAYNDALIVNDLNDAFASEGKEADEEYLSLLNINESGVISYIEIPKITVKLPVFHGTSSEVLSKGVGHMEGTALPVGGTGTHAVLTGHTGYSTVKLFTDIRELKEGDEFYVHTLDQILAYRIDQIKVVEPTVVEDLLPIQDKDYMTLVTCTPYGVNSHRLLVRGERVDYTPEEIDERIAETDAVLSQETLMLYAAIGLIVLLVLIILIFRLLKRKYNRSE